MNDWEVIKMKITELDYNKLANALLKTPLVSMKLNHKHLSSSLRDYVSPDAGLEVEYVRDLFTLTTDEIITKWYGGDEKAPELLSNL